MSASQHITWLNLVEKIGPFLAVSVLDEAFPQGLEKVETRRRQRVRSAYDEWRDAVDAEDTELAALQREWVRRILEELLEYDSAMLRANDQLPAALVYREPMCGVEVRPTFAATTGETARLLIAVYSPNCDLTAPLPGDAWITASPIERMMQLCRATGVRLGLVTNGERWSVVSVPSEGSSSVATWFARIWQQEPVTLQAFVSLLGVRRCFGPTAGTLETLLANSLNDQNEITDTLGEQARRAVEVLVQALDKADAAQNRTLLTGVTPPQLYEAGLTVMMRLVVLLCAEQRGLLLLGVDTYDQHYAATTLRVRLEKEKKDLTDDVQERRHDAWARLLALCRGVFGGIEHATLRLPPLGGSLFDPDRFPFLEGRAAGTNWRETPALPLPIDNRTVLTLLSALQVLERTAGAQFLSYEALDVEQIGHVYEGLLERTVRRVPEVTVGLVGSAKAYNPNIALIELEEKSGEDRDSLLTFLQEQTGRSESALRKALDRPADDAVRHRLAMACGTRTELVPRLLSFANVIREDAAKRLLIYDKGSFIVTLGDSRRVTGAHYTPKLLTEPIVQHTLEPLVYVGSAEGKQREEWRLKSPADLLSLKICDMAMGSAAFLVQACRWFADRVVEAWDAAEKSGQSVSMEGAVLELAGSTELLPRDKAERVLIARRLVASRCLYGVDINPMGVELAKVSLWLVTMMKGRPFSFLDHALKCGDSLLGVSSLKQIEDFSLRPGERQVTFATANLFRYVEQSRKKRRELEDLPSNDLTQIEIKNRLHAEAEAATAKVKALADSLIALELRGLYGNAYTSARETEADQVQRLFKKDADAALESPISNQPSALTVHAQEQLRGRRPFHWPVEFPEVFALGGFNSFVGNPPFMGEYRIIQQLAPSYRDLVIAAVANGRKGKADLCTYFFLRAYSLMSERACLGLIGTNSIGQGDSAEVGLRQIRLAGGRIFRAVSSMCWPGAATIQVAVLWVAKGPWGGTPLLDGGLANEINEYLVVESSKNGAPNVLQANSGKSFKGCEPYGGGFILDPDEAAKLIDARAANAEVVKPYLTGDDLNSSPVQAPSRFAIFFQDWPLSRTKQMPSGQPCAEDYPECLEIVEKRVRLERKTKADDVARAPWWQFWRSRGELYATLHGKERAIARSRVSNINSMAFVPTDIVLSDALVVLALSEWSEFAVVQSTLHDVWINVFGSSMRTDLRYTSSTCFETFPFPTGLPTLQPIGERYYDFRREIMQTRQEGLTKTYNRFHKRSEGSADIVRLRALHVELDQALATAYGWSDLDLGHGFHATKQGERYTIIESARRTVLDRLLALNHQRYAEEVKAGPHEKGVKRGKLKRSKNAVAQVDFL